MEGSEYFIVKNCYMEENILTGVNEGALIAEVYPGTLAAEIGLQPGDRILRLNGQKIQDLIQFQWEWAGETIDVEICSAEGTCRTMQIEKEYDQGLGAMFEAPVFDEIRPCANRCLFCFVDQMPPGFRPTLYIKDDDYRLSFLQGSFVTLTNLSARDKQRIIEERLSPLYVSVHATDPTMRSILLGRKGEDHLLETLQALDAQGIEFHTQIVLCPGYNDGEILEKTYQDLVALQGTRTLAVVPVGLTQFREGLTQLSMVTKDQALAMIRWVEQKQAESLERRGERFVWLSDEFYILADASLPPAQTYEGYPQLENGVGLLRCLLEETEMFELPAKLNHPVRLVAGAGLSALKGLESLWQRLRAVEGLDLQVIGLPNRFFGDRINVSGLLTGRCLLEGLSGLEKATRVLLPEVMIRDRGDAFLDGMKVSEVEEALEIRLVFLPADGMAMMQKIFNEELKTA